MTFRDEDDLKVARRENRALEVQLAVNNAVESGENPQKAVLQLLGKGPPEIVGNKDRVTTLPTTSRQGGPNVRKRSDRRVRSSSCGRNVRTPVGA